MSITLDTVLETERCILRSVSEGDADSYWEAMQYPGFTDGLLINPAKSREEVSEWIKIDRVAWGKSEKFAFTIQRNNQEIIGRINLRASQDIGRWHMGFWILPKYWGNGYAAEAAIKVVEFAFRFLKARKICAAHTRLNLQSKRVIEKMGMHVVQNNDKGFLNKGKWVANIRYEITRDDWLKKNVTKDVMEEV